MPPTMITGFCVLKLVATFLDGRQDQGAVRMPVVDGHGAVWAYDEAHVLHQSAPEPSGKVMVKLVMATVSPAVIEVVFKIMSAEEVPHVP
jgi:hypothetical protein